MRLASGILLGVVLWAAAAGAQAPDQACAGDIEKFCKDVQVGGGRIMHCLRQHGTELSPTCKDAFAAMAHAGGKPTGGGWFHTCEPDVAKFCKDTPPGRGKLVQCLTGHSDELAPACKTALQTRPHQETKPAAN